MTRLKRLAIRVGMACIALGTFAIAARAADIPTIRFGRQTAAEDNLWLMMADPKLAPNFGKLYNVEWTQLRASDVAFKAFEAGQVDLMSTNANASIAAAANGISLKIIATLSRESEKGAHTYWLAKKQGGPSSIKDLKGKTIGILGYRTGTELWAREALKSAGLNPDTDVQWAVVPFAAAADAVRSGRVAASVAVEAFAEPALAKGDLKVIFSSKTGMPFDEDLIVINAKPAYLASHGAAVRAFLSDLVGVTRYLDAHLKEGRQILLDKKFVAMPPAIYLNLKPYAGDPGLHPNVASLTKQQDVLVSAGFQDKKIDIGTLVDASYLPK